MSRTPKGVDMLTAAVLDAREMILRRTQELTGTYKPGAFMTAKVSPRTMEKYLLGLTEQDMMQLASTDPARAEQYAARVNQLEQKLDSRMVLPAQDSFEGEIEEP